MQEGSTRLRVDALVEEYRAIVSKHAETDCWTLSGSWTCCVILRAIAREYLEKLDTISPYDEEGNTFATVIVLAALSRYAVTPDKERDHAVLRDLCAIAFSRLVRAGKRQSAHDLLTQEEIIARACGDYAWVASCNKRRSAVFA